MRDEKRAPLKTPAWEASSSYTLLFPSKKLRACLGQVHKIINLLRLQGSRTKKSCLQIRPCVTPRGQGHSLKTMMLQILTI